MWIAYNMDIIWIEQELQRHTCFNLLINLFLTDNVSIKFYWHLSALMPALTPLTLPGHKAEMVDLLT